LEALNDDGTALIFPEADDESCVVKSPVEKPVETFEARSKQSSANSVRSTSSRKKEAVVKQSSVNSVGTGSNKSSRKEESVVKQSRVELQKPQDDQRDDDELQLWCGNMIYSGGLRLRDCCEDVVTDEITDYVFGPIDDDDDDNSLTEETGIASRAASTAVNDVFDESKFEEKKRIKEKVKRAKEKISSKYEEKKFVTKEKVKSAKEKVKSAKERLKSAKIKMFVFNNDEEWAAEHTEHSQPVEDDEESLICS